MKISVKKGSVSLIFILLLWLAVAAVVFGLTLTRRVNASLRKLPVYSVDTGEEKKVAFTFNAAWDNETTDDILQILKKNGIKASFFFVGEFAEKYPEAVKKIANEGHDIGNHSMFHKDPVKQDFTAICADMEQCSELLCTLTGKMPLYYRAPSGSYDNKTVEAAQNLGMTAVQWDIDSIDWKELRAEEITKRVIKKLSPGGIMLFHLGRDNTLQALPEIIASVKEQGYDIIPLSELLLDGDTYIDANGKQHRAESVTNNLHADEKRLSPQP